MTDPKKAKRIEEVQSLLDEISKDRLTPELAGYVRRLWEQISRKRNYVITGGQPEIWASAVVYVIARLNFLFDRSQPDYLPPDAICDFFGTKKTTIASKAAQIEKACKIRMGQEGLCRPEISDSLSFVQLSNGMVVTSQMAGEMGLLGPLDSRLPPEQEGHMLKPATEVSAAQASSGEVQLYTLEVFILSGPMTESFAKENRVIARTIQIREDQTLQELHRAIFDAFDREEEHMYEFQIGGKGPMDPKARRYVLHADRMNLVVGGRPAGEVERTTIGSLGLKVDAAFGYWFDFGDDWWHQINVVSIEEKAGRGGFPKVIKRTGQSPPQYVDWDQEQ